MNSLTGEEQGTSGSLVNRNPEGMRLKKPSGFVPVARGDARPDSDIDLLIDLEPGRSLLDVGGLAMDLTDMLGRPVDVVTGAGLRDRIRTMVLQEARAI